MKSLTPFRPDTAGDRSRSLFCGSYGTYAGIVMNRLAMVSSVALGVAGCGSDPSVSADGSGGTSGVETTGGVDAGGTALSADVTGNGDPTQGSADGTAGDDETESGEPVPPPPATGIEIVEVTADQGLRIPVFLDGAIVPGGQREGPLFQGRAMVLRGFYETDPDYEDRGIFGVLTVVQSDGSTSEYESYVNTTRPDCDPGVPLHECGYGLATSSFFWRIDAEDVRPDTTYRAELFETSPGHEDDVSDKSPVFPADGGTELIGIESSYMKMRVVVVPFFHAIGGDCAEAPDLLEEFGTDYHGNPRTVADYLGERLYAQNPVDEVEIIVHDVVNFSGSMQEGQLLGELQQLRFEEGAPPEYYYYGVARPCDGGPEFSGLAQIGGPSPGQAAQRVGWGVYHASVSTTAETFVHEIGHEQGRYHVACSGMKEFVDITYPDHPEGDIESWGIDVMSNPIAIKPPSAHDYMTYCGQTWVSWWGWELVMPWIETISSWELADAVAPRVPLLVGTVRADGSSQWYATEGYFDPALASESHRLRFFADGVQLDERLVQWVQWERTEDYNVIVALPEGWSQVDSLSWHAPGRSGVIGRASVAKVEVTDAFAR